MKRPTVNRSLSAGALLTLCLAVPAGAASIDEVGMTAKRGSRATHGSGIARMVTESIQIRHGSAQINGDTAISEFLEIALDRVLTSGRADVFSNIVLANSVSVAQHAAIQQPVLSAELLSAPGTSSISVAGKETLGPWNIVPEQSERFLQVALGMMALGFVPSALRRSS